MVSIGDGQRTVKATMRWPVTSATRQVGWPPTALLTGMDARYAEESRHTVCTEERTGIETLGRVGCYLQRYGDPHPDSTIAENTVEGNGGGFVNLGPAFSARNTIIAGNTALVGSGPDLNGVLT